MDNIATVIIQSIITIVGFVVTYLGIRLNLKNELVKRKSELHIERMAEMPYKLLDIMNKNNMQKTKAESVTIEDLNNILTTIYAYGSKEAIKIAAHMQKKVYLNNQDKWEMICLYPLLANQIKYDITGIFITSDFWFDMKLNDYNSDSEIHNKLIDINNNLVRELDVDKHFFIPDDIRM